MVHTGPEPFGLDDTDVIVHTHDGFMNADEILAAGIILLKVILDPLMTNRRVYVLRTRAYPAGVRPPDYTVDLGGVYDPEARRFDHHKVEADRDDVRLFGKPYLMASAGMVFREYGAEVAQRVLGLANEFLLARVYSSFVGPIDAIDNGHPACEHNHSYSAEDGFSVAQGDCSWNHVISCANDDPSPLAHQNAIVYSALVFVMTLFAAAVDCDPEEIEPRSLVSFSGEAGEIAKRYLTAVPPLSVEVSNTCDRAHAYFPLNLRDVRGLAALLANDLDFFMAAEALDYWVAKVIHDSVRKAIRDRRKIEEIYEDWTAAKRDWIVVDFRPKNLERILFECADAKNKGPGDILEHLPKYIVGHSWDYKTNAVCYSVRSMPKERNSFEVTHPLVAAAGAGGIVLRGGWKAVACPTVEDALAHLPECLRKNLTEEDPDAILGQLKNTPAPVGAVRHYKPETKLDPVCLLDTFVSMVGALVK